MPPVGHIAPTEVTRLTAPASRVVADPDAHDFRRERQLRHAPEEGLPGLLRERVWEHLLLPRRRYRVAGVPPDLSGYDCVLHASLEDVVRLLDAVRAEPLPVAEPHDVPFDVRGRHVDDGLLAEVVFDVVEVRVVPLSGGGLDLPHGHLRVDVRDAVLVQALGRGDPCRYQAVLDALGPLPAEPERLLLSLVVRVVARHVGSVPPLDPLAVDRRHDLDVPHSVALARIYVHLIPQSGPIRGQKTSKNAVRIVWCKIRLLAATM